VSIWLVALDVLATGESAVWREDVWLEMLNWRAIWLR